MFKSNILIALVLSLSIATYRLADAYSQILTSGSTDAANEGPRIYKALNMDLIFPKTFNSSENVISTTTMTTSSPVHFPQEQSQLELQSTDRNAPAATIFVTPPPPSSNEAQYAEEPAAEPAQAENTEQQPQTNIQEQEYDDQRQPYDQEPQPQQQQELQQYASTGRAVDYRPALGQLITPLIRNSGPRQSSYGPSYRQRERPPYASRPQQTQSSIGKIIYPQAYSQRQRQQTSREKAQISDRFTPSEAVASAQFSKNKHNHDHSHNHNHNPSGNSGKVAASSNLVQSYVPPKDLYSFPPNSNSKYPSPSDDPKAAMPTSSINSYIAPPSGPLKNGGGYPLATASSNSNGYQYPGPVVSDYLPPGGGDKDTDDSKDAPKGNDDDGDTDDGGDGIGVLPASAMDMGGGGDAGGDGDKPADDGGDMGGDDHDHGHDHSPLTGYDTEKEYPTPPPGWLEEHPDSAHDHPHDHDPHDDHSPPEINSHHGHDHHFDFHDHFPSYPSYHDHHYPEIIYDDHHHDHHHHVEPPPTLPPAPTEAPPPEPPPEPRVKKYSYFYIGRKLWYIPLYFTVWFSFYVLWLILKSIARHKVNLPNHYVSRRSLPEYSDARAEEYINQLTVSVLGKIDGFKRKYLT